MEAKISIVIPAYNTAELLPKCLESVLGQSMRELEIIIINDGSTDATADVCNHYAEADSRVRVIHKVNAGVSEARNTGIRHATGEYFWFVDSDDIIYPNTCEQLYRIAKENNADIVIFDYSRVRDGADAGTFQSVFSAGVYEGDFVISGLLERFLGFSNEGIHRWICSESDGLYVENPALWRTLLRGVTVRDNDLSFDPSLRVGEDTIFISLFLSYSSRAVVTHSVHYCQMLHDTSTISRYEKDSEAKLQSKLALLDARCALTESVAARRGVDIGSCWQGTVVMSYMELCFLFAQRAPNAGFWARYKRFLCYAKNPRVVKSLSEFPLPRCLCVRAVPFWLMKLRFHGILFLCAAILGFSNFQFIRK